MNTFRKVTLLIAVTCFSAALLLTLTQKNHDEVKIKVTPAPVVEVTPSVQPVPKPKPMRVHYIVKAGDTLSNIFAAWGIGYQTVHALLSADMDHLQLDTIRAGQILEIVVDQDKQQVLKVIYHLSLIERAVYTLDENGEFYYQFEEDQGTWEQQLISGTIEGSFSLSAYHAGLSSNQIANLTTLLGDKINFARSLRSGDQFHVLLNRQYLDDHPTGNSEILAATIHLRSKEVAAFSGGDGRFYDRKGESLQSAFNRYPVDKKYRRITSAFNPKRKHPVTGRVTPHNGTDFATPVGAPVYSTGDGKVVGVRNHPYAGKYLVIEHNSVYKTRYLHLSRFLVKKGQRVTRGQKVALAGATGRLTGPHLHFEVLVRDRAVDPMKVNLPMARSLAAEHQDEFENMMLHFDQLVSVQQSSETVSSL